MTEESGGPLVFPFIIARGRSGTTLLRAMLDAHPLMAIPDESHFIVQFAKRRRAYEVAGGFDLDRFSRDLVDHWAFRRWGFPATAVLEAYAASPPADYATAIRGLYSAYARSHGKTRYADKTPNYVLHIDLLASMFPEARFIHLIRDGRDVALSYLDMDFGSRTLGQAILAWDSFVRAGREAGARLGPERYREIRYEDLVRDPLPVLTDLCSFVDLDFDDRMLRYYERTNRLDVAHDGPHRNLHKPPTVGLRDWRRDASPRDIEVMEALSGGLLEELGYERATSSRSFAVLLRATRYTMAAYVRRIGHAARIRVRKLYRRSKRRLFAPRSRPAATQPRITS